PTPAAAAPLASPRTTAAAEAAGFVSGFDARGDRVVWIVRPLAAGGSFIVAATVNEPEGLRDVHVAQASRQQGREVRRRRAAAAPFVDEIRTVRESPLVLSRAAGEERVREVLRRAAASLFPAAVLARRLRGTAYVLAETGRPSAARQALAVAARIAERPADALEVPFVAALVER